MGKAYDCLPEESRVYYREWGTVGRSLYMVQALMVHTHVSIQWEQCIVLGKLQGAVRIM